MTLISSLTFTKLRVAYGAFATGVACHEGTLTLPVTWFRPPFLGVAYVPIVWSSFPELLTFLYFSP